MGKLASTAAWKGALLRELKSLERDGVRPKRESLRERRGAAHSEVRKGRGQVSLGMGTLD